MDVPDLDPVLHQSARFRMMLLLFQNRQAAATWVMKVLGLTDGNLRSHANKLVQAGYLVQGRVLTTDGFHVRYRITPEGDLAIRKYLRDLQALLTSTADLQAALFPESGWTSGTGVLGSR